MANISSDVTTNKKCETDDAQEMYKQTKRDDLSLETMSRYHLAPMQGTYIYIYGDSGGVDQV